MSISSTAGGEVTDNGGPISSTPSTTTELTGGIASASPAAEGGERPPWLPEGFATEAEFMAAYNAPRGPDGGLVKPEAAKPDAAAETDPLKPATEEKAPEGVRSDDEIKASLKEAGGIFADPRYEAGALEFEKTGDVSDAIRDKLAAEFGVPRNAVDQFIAGQQAQRTMVSSTADASLAKATAEIHAVIGSEADYGKFMGWAGENLSDAEKVAYNEALDKSPNAAKVMLAGFNEKYKAAGNGAPRDITTEAGGSGGQASTAATGYASSAEMKADMGSDKYREDPAFRAVVAAKVAASKF